LAGVERIRAPLRQAAQRCRVRRILHDRADRARSVVVQEVRLCAPAQILFGCDHRMEARRNGESILGKRNRRREQRRPRKSTMFAMRSLE
jgi:hypothetical protein